MNEHDDISTEPRALLLDRKAMARAISLSESVLDGLRKRGCPSIKVPGVRKPLFNPSRVVEWLEAQNEPAQSLTATEASRKADEIFR